MYVDLYTNTYTHTQTFNRGTCAKDLKINFYFWLLIYIKEQRSEKITKILHNSTYKDIYRERRKCVGNSDVITRALDALIRSEGCESSHAAPAPRTPEDDRDSHYFVSTGSSLLNLLDSVYKHSEHCAESLTCRHDKTFIDGNVVVYSLQCSYGHCVSWTSSPFLQNWTFLANTRLMHASLSTGLLPSQVDRHKSVIGFYPQQLQDEKELISQNPKTVQDEKNTSCGNALREEKRSSEQDMDQEPLAF